MDRSGKPNESDRVARHRNLMHDIALKKQISVIQREGRLLERELREITKVKKTLMQLRDPIRKRVAQAQSDELEEKQAINKASVLYGIPRQSKNINSGNYINNKRSSISHTRGVLLKNRVSMKTRVACKTDSQIQENESSDSGTSLPSIKNNLASCLTICEARGSNVKQQETKRPETSMTVPTVRRRSLTIPQPPSTSLGHRKEEKSVSNNASMSLTMEETLRIKGKFRQIGHSIIATALLKGLRQRGQLTSEAIHNMHKPISFDEKEKTEDSEEQKTSPGLNRFRSLTRKAINVNTAFKSSNAKKTEDVRVLQLDSPSSSTTHRKIATTDDTSPFEKPEPSLVNGSTLRRRKIGIGGIEHTVMLAKTMNMSIDGKPNDSKTVRFGQEAWE